MKTRRTIELNIEHTSVVTRRSPPRAIFAWCAGCGAEVQLVRPEETSRYTDVSTRTIYRRIEAGEIHFIESEDSLLICLDSLIRLEEREGKQNRKLKRPQTWPG
jgi:hypothetical protein